MRAPFLAGALAALALSGSAPVSAQPSPRPTGAAAVVDGSYVQALAAANSFLVAWARRDAEGGIKLLTPAAVRRYPKDDLVSYFVGTSSPTNTSFEVGSGRMVAPTRYVFKVILYRYLNGMDAQPHPKPASLIVVRSDAGTWLVDNLPEAQ